MKFSPSDIHPFAYTHIHYAFAIVNESDQLAITPDQRDQIVRMKKHFEKHRSTTKIVLSVGGWAFNNPGPTQRRFTDMSSTPQRRARFIDSAINLPSELDIDGLDIDWYRTQCSCFLRQIWSTTMPHSTPQLISNVIQKRLTLIQPHTIHNALTVVARSKISFLTTFCRFCSQLATQMCLVVSHDDTIRACGRAQAPG
ncbi:glycoside hydrolase superfamily [Catenaria anguillulae PL171]|uniref:Glycoside hydrolase superfamily n=1 Tax=Catenaria anguillulae PL171 TaxID=765915 RepID=A0A1Y2HMY5_9FUNG|nr:glycoside hydrolase superfamily [Catenaria anguillulae PL171]